MCFIVILNLVFQLILYFLFVPFCFSFCVWLFFVLCLSSLIYFWFLYVSNCFRCNVRFFTWDVSCFLRYVCIAINFPLRTAFASSHRFWVIVFSLSFVSKYFLISSLISSVICWLFSSVLFSLHVCTFYRFFSCNWYLVS